MDYKEITIYTKTQAIDIVSGMLTMHGVKGVVIEDSVDFNEFLQSGIENWGMVDDCLMPLKSSETNVKFYLPQNIQGVEMYNAIKAELPKLPAENPEIDFGRLYIESADVNEEDWANEWKKYYHITKIGSRLVVVPVWENYEKKPGEVTVILDPGMAFGTGSHETTRLCMCFLEKLVDENTKMLDIGTGSGILSITALRLGAKSALGVDIDELAVKIAGENAELNGVRDKIELVWGDLVEKVSGKYNLVCANIVADVIIRLAPDVRQYMADNARLIVSGIIEERADEVKTVLEEHGFTVCETITENGWAAMLLK